MATATGSTMRMPMVRAGASMSNVKRHAVVFVAIIKTNKRMEINYRDYYPQSVYKHPEPMEMMISTPKDFGQYIQNKRNRRRKK